MKKTKYIKFLVAAMLLGGLATSCMDDDWNDPTNGSTTVPFGNNNIQEDDSKIISIKDLKAQTVDVMDQKVNYDERHNLPFYAIRIENDWQIKVRVTGNDIQGNIYNEVSVEDASGEGLLICIQKGGLYGFLPVGQEILVNLKDLYIGIYGNNVQLGTFYKNNEKGREYPGRMLLNTWNNHFKILGVARPDLVEPEVFDLTKLKDESYIKSHRNKLMTLENVEMDGADGKLAWAPEADKDPGNGVSRTVIINGKAQKLMVVRSSTYADFAAKAMPTGKVNLTGIFTVYATNPSKKGYTWQILLRSDSDIEEVK